MFYIKSGMILTENSNILANKKKKMGEVGKGKCSSWRGGRYEEKRKENKRKEKREGEGEGEGRMKKGTSLVKPRI